MNIFRKQKEAQQTSKTNLYLTNRKGGEWERDKIGV